MIQTSQVLARKWRPQKFSELIGQNHVSQTLLNALQSHRIPQAILLTGVRGTGKTSTARIFSMSLRCPNAVDWVPCGQCVECQDIAQGRSLNVLEIDGASNNGVDAIRELRDGVSFRPSHGHYKIYIIDEVHMLSSSAFNALLKTLEEPPPHVVFILATTEAHKIPATILSRCQRYDFRRIRAKEIVRHLAEIAERENFKISEDALWAIARQGDGSVRDSLSLLDQMMVFAIGEINLAQVSQILALTDQNLLLQIVAAIVKRDVDAILGLLRAEAITGNDPERLLGELLTMLRNLLFLKMDAQSQELLELADSETVSLQELTPLATVEDIHLLFDLGLKLNRDLSSASSAQLALEMGLLRMAQAPNIQNLKTLLEKVGNEVMNAGGSQAGLPMAGVSKGNAVQPKGGVPPAEKPPQQKFATSMEIARTSRIPVNTENSKSVVRPVELVAGISPRDRWLKFVDQVRSVEPLYAAKLENVGFIEENEGVLFLQVPARFAFLREQIFTVEGKTKLESLLRQFWAPGAKFDVAIAKPGEAIASAAVHNESKSKEAKDILLKAVTEHPLVRKAAQTFQGKIKPVDQ